MTNDYRVSQVKVNQREPERESRIISYKTTQFVWLLFGLLIAMIALRIGLKLIGANPESLIASLIYHFKDLFMFPFTGLVNSPTTSITVLEISSIYAILIYGLIALGVGKVIGLVFYRPVGPIVEVKETTTSEHSN